MFTKVFVKVVVEVVMTVISSVVMVTIIMVIMIDLRHNTTIWSVRDRASQVSATGEITPQIRPDLGIEDTVR